MSHPAPSRLDEAEVAALALPGARYPADPGDRSLHEALEQLGGMLGWSSADGGPFGAVVPPGARVLIKPNWVSHQNQGTGGFEPLVTHGSLVRAVAETILRAAPGSVLVGDAPLQACDFPALMEASGLRDWAAALQARDPRFQGLHDFRRTRSTMRNGVREAREDQRPMDRFVLFDLGAESLLEPITEAGTFRVTQYDPRLMERTHAPGRHQYLVARDVIEADVLVNLPKLKTHKKAGITCALKNLIGINGNKEYLPHHRVGGSEAGGDCYPGRSRVKRMLEHALDQQNTSRSPAATRGWNGMAELLHRLAHSTGDRIGVEGSWSGNDTIWRTCLDLNRILLYGRLDGTLAETPQRRVLHLVDAVVAGQGDGPLAPDPLPLGLLLAGGSAPAVDWVGSWLLGYLPSRIPISREAFGRFRWPLAHFAGADVSLRGDLGDGRADDLLQGWAERTPVRHPLGWRDAAVEASSIAAP